MTRTARAKERARRTRGDRYRILMLRLDVALARARMIRNERLRRAERRRLREERA